LSVPKELDGTGGDGTNPEQLFAAGYAACYDSALWLVARMTASNPSPANRNALLKNQSHPEGISRAGLWSLSHKLLSRPCDPLCSFASKQGVEAPVATAPRGYVQIDKTEQDGGNALILNRRHAIWCVKLPVRNRHHARKDKSNGPRSEAKHDRDPAKELKEPTDSHLGHQGRGTGLSRNAAKPAKQDQAARLNE
jgi:hypothetical protein